MGRFELGQTLATPGAIRAMEESEESPLELIQRHARGDWGDLSPADRRANEQALRDGTRLLSAYVLRDGTTRVWIITEADRSATTILLSDEY